MLKKKSVRLMLGLAVAAVALTGALATAAWLTSGTGNGSAKADTAKTLTLGDASSSAVAQLYPGAKGDLKVKVTNPNSFPVQLTSIAGNGTITSDKGSACDATTGVSYTAPADVSSATYKFAAGETKTLSLTDAVAMSNASDDACQGATFTVPVKILAASAA